MARWDDVERAAPGLAGRARRVLDAHRHKTLATLRRDGSPRISGTEAVFVAGDVWVGSMPGAVKALDLLRDPRFALHSASEDPDDEDPGAWQGDAKVAGRAVEITDPAEAEAFYQEHGPPPQPGESHLFRLDLTEVVLTRVDPPDQLVIESWHEGKGYQRRQRK